MNKKDVEAIDTVLELIDKHIAWCKSEKEQDELEFWCEAREALANMREANWWVS